MSSGLKEVVHAIKTQSQPNTPSNSSPLGVNWTPIIQGLVTAVATTLGASVKFTPTGQSSDEVPLANSSTLETPVSQENLTLTPYGDRGQSGRRVFTPLEDLIIFPFKMGVAGAELVPPPFDSLFELPPEEVGVT
ncbi:hypothetical protein C1646_776185 [Rhizophagus diaphanus]|nr:hypothetical protein C1646_776185 [Rhizophagus diaphanus] [Rhizophagus sp. MUCL 43196]